MTTILIDKNNSADTHSASLPHTILQTCANKETSARGIPGELTSGSRDGTEEARVPSISFN
jgi:hypothetical protein